MRKLFIILFLFVGMSCFAHDFKTGGYFSIPQVGILYPHDGYSNGVDRTIGRITEIHKIDENTVKVVVKMSAASSSYTYYWSKNEVIPLYKLPDAYASSNKNSYFLYPPVLNRDETPSYFMKVIEFRNNSLTIEHGNSL